MTIRIVALGDSLTEGYPFQQEYSWVNILADEQKWDIVNRGTNGETTGEMLGRFIQDVVFAKCQVVIITGGANDVFQQVPMEITFGNYRTMLDLAKQYQILPVLGLTLPIDEPELEEELKMLRIQLLDTAKQLDLPIIDFYSALVDVKSGLIAQQWDYDGVHPNPQGYRCMAKTAQPILAGAINQVAGKMSEANLKSGIYRHYKGNMYQVLGVAKHSETMEDVVVYRALYGDGGLWVRPLSMFAEFVEVNGNKVKRFEFVEA
jgi:acyl-CoA thioesterase I